MTDRLPLFFDATSRAQRQMTSANGDTIPQALIPVVTGRQLLYASSGATVGVGPSSTARSTMLPPAALGGLNYFKVPANAMPNGSALSLSGFGNVSASTVAAGTNYTVFPYVQTTVGGTKTDLPTGGNTVALTVGVAGPAFFDMVIQQVGTNVLLTGCVSYGTQNGMSMAFQLNMSGTLVASDPTVDRYFGVDGQWSTSNAANYEVSVGVTAYLFGPFATGQVAYEFTAFVGGVPAASWIIGRTRPSTNVNLSASLSSADAGTAFTSAATFTLKAGATSIGTAAFAAGGTTGTITITTPYVPLGTALSVVAPSTADATGADIDFVFAGTRA